MTFLIFILILSGFFFLAVSALGALRLPDFYTRSHALGVTDTLGTLLILGALALHFGASFTSAKLLFIILFVYIANPTITHILVRAALRSGLQPWVRQKKTRYD